MAVHIPNPFRRRRRIKGNKNAAAISLPKLALRLFVGFLCQAILVFHFLVASSSWSSTTRVSVVDDDAQAHENQLYPPSSSSHQHHQHHQVLLSTNETVTCVAWRATESCHPNGPLLSSSFVSNFVDTDLSCREYIPFYASGYCELETESEKGTTPLIRAFQQNGCQHGRLGPWQFKRFLPWRFSCQQAVSFLNYKYYAHTYEPPLAIPFFHHHSSQNPTRGIVMEIYDSVLPSVYAIVQLLRQVYNCQLPMELWHSTGEISNSNPILQQLLHEDNNIQVRIIKDRHIHSYMTKPYSIAYSHFDQVLFLDSDSFPTRDPTYLFETREFVANGALFWKDFWSTERNDFVMTQDSLVWELLFGLDSNTNNNNDDNNKHDFFYTYNEETLNQARKEMEMESGQLLIDRRTGHEALKVLLFLSETFEDWLDPLYLVWGDKDLFRLAWYMTQTPFHYISKPPGVAGYAVQTWLNLDRVCGVTMVQHDPAGHPVFFHRNGDKLSSRSSLKKMWNKGLEFIGTNVATEYDMEGSTELPYVHSALCGCYHPKAYVRDYFREVDYRGTDVEVLEETILDFAQEALDILDGIIKTT